VTRSCCARAGRKSLAEIIYEEIPGDEGGEEETWLVLYDFGSKPNPRFWGNIRRLIGLVGEGSLVQYSVFMTRSRRGAMAVRARWIEEGLYEEIRRRLPIPSVDVLPVYGGRLLLLRRRNDPGRGLWWTSGGRIRLGETLEQAAARELAEETGLQAEGLEVRGVMCHFWPRAQFVTAFLRADVSTDEVRFNSEHSEHVWIRSCRDDLHPYVRARNY